ncbi:MAG: hypothetical protein AAB434_02110, partial [Planctomycetota bacterium]
TLGIDEETMYLVTESIAERGGVNVGPSMLRETWTVPARGGGRYSILEVGQSVLALPFYYIGKLGASIAPTQLRPYATRAAVAAMGPVFGALAVLLVALLVEALGHSPARAAAVALLAAFGTILWPYARTFYREPVLAALFLAIVWALVRWRDDGRMRWVVLASTAFFLAGIVRVLALGLFPFFAAAIWRAGLDVHARGDGAPARGPGRPYMGNVAAAAIFGVGAIAALAVDLGYNALRFGSPWATGYPKEETFSHPLHIGLYGFLFSPGRSVFLFCPVLVIAMFGLPRMWREARETLGLVAAVVIFHLCVYGCWWAWANGRGLWGPRYLVPMLPLALLPAAWVKPGRLWIGVLGLSIAIQAMGVLTWGRFLAAPEKERARVEVKAFDVTHSAVLSGDAWASLGTLRWDRAYEPSVLRDPHSPEAHDLKATTAAVWWAYAWRANLPLRTLAPAVVLAALALGSMIALGVRAFRNLA